MGRRWCGERRTYVDLLSQFKRTYVLITNYDYITGTKCNIISVCRYTKRACRFSGGAQRVVGRDRDRDGLARIDCGYSRQYGGGIQDYTPVTEPLRSAA